MKVVWILRMLLVAALAAGVVAFLACDEGDGDGDADVDSDSDSDTDSDSDGDTDTDTDTDGDVDEDGDTPVDADDDGGDADADTGPTTLRMGRIALIEIQVAPTVFANMTTIMFWNEMPGACWVEDHAWADGECTLRTYLAAPTDCDPACTGDEVCTWNDDCSAGVCVDPGEPGAPLEAGDITVTGATGQATVTCTPDATSGAYTCDLDSSTNWWDDGDTLTVAGAGSTFPAFTQDVDVPLAITLTSSHTLADFDGSAAVTMTWTSASPAAPGVAIQISGSNGTLTCATDDDGSFEIPAEAITAAGTVSSVMIGSADRETVNEGVDGHVDIAAALAAGLIVM